MENAPTILLFWQFVITIFILMIALITASIILTKKGKEQRAKNIQFLGKMCLILSIICSISIFLVVGYILYLYMG